MNKELFNRHPSLKTKVRFSARNTGIIIRLLSHFFSTKTYVMGTQNSLLYETILLSTSKQRVLTDV